MSILNYKQTMPKNIKPMLNPIKELSQKIKFRFRIAINKHGKHKCAICDFRINKFLPLSKNFRTTVNTPEGSFSFKDYETLNYNSYLCPMCGSPDRARLIYIWLGKYLNSKNLIEQNILHFAPEKSLTEKLTKHNGVKVTKADLCMKDTEKQDICNLTYTDNSFDIVLCSHVFEHLLDDKKAARELCRVLRPNGVAIVLVPIISNLEKTYEDNRITSPEERLKHFGQDDHVRIYSKNDFIALFKSNGFEVKTIKSSDLMSQNQIVENGLSPNSTLYLAFKPENT